MKIYTKTGDDGTTGLIGGDRIAKNSHRMQAIGDVDELNAAIGLARATSSKSGPREVDADLERIQNWLFDLGAELASLTNQPGRYRSLDSSQTEFLEQSIDRQVASLEPLRNFIVPGGSDLSAALHFARCICRRAERSLLELDAREPVETEAKVFLNRLSDWLFVCARTSNRLLGVQDVKWGRTGE